VFWNNFNFHAGAPFKPKASGVVPLVPIGTGILLLGGRTNTVENNRVYGHYLVGAAAIEGFLLDKTAKARALIGNRISGNAFGADGEDLNARDLAYDGNGSGNCWGPNAGVRSTLPADGSMFPACPFGGANAFSQDAQNELFTFAGANALKGWIEHPHKAKPGYTPLEVYEK
jgi:hypothetical protein